MNENNNEELNKKVESLEGELAQIRKDVERKEDRPNLARKYILWLFAGILIIGFYAAYYFYVMSLF